MGDLRKIILKYHVEEEFGVGVQMKVWDFAY